MPHPIDLARTLLPIALLVVIAVALVVRRVRFHCQRCNGKVRALRDLASEEREQVLDFFRRVEGRRPPTGKIYVCPRCKSVYDDFSGEHLSRDQDVHQLVAFCKVCGSLMHREGAASDAIACNHCGALHRWRRQAPSGHVFLSRADGQPVTIVCVDYSLGGA